MKRIGEVDAEIIGGISEILECVNGSQEEVEKSDRGVRRVSKNERTMRMG